MVLIPLEKGWWHMPSLLPTDLETSTVSEEEMIDALNDTPTGYKKSVYFDEKTGDLRMDGSGKIVESTKEEAWIQWCVKCLETPRFKCFAYSTDIGIDTDEVFRANNRKEAESILTREISEALSADPYGRTEYVRSVTFNWISPDSVEVTVEVIGIEGEFETLQAVISS